MAETKTISRDYALAFLNKDVELVREGADENETFVGKVIVVLGTTLALSVNGESVGIPYSKIISITAV